jgi:hypothetical protein
MYSHKNYLVKVCKKKFLLKMSSRKLPGCFQTDREFVEREIPDRADQGG